MFQLARGGEMAIEQMRNRKVSEAAEILNVSVYTLRSWIAARKIEHLKLGGCIRILDSEIERLLEESRIPATTRRGRR
jgi:excisionase family DNA binding protein